MYYARHLETVLSGALSRNKVRLLFGARQTGKTVLLRHLLAGEGTSFYNLQDTSLRRTFEVDPGAFGRALRALPRSTRTIVVDEIQKVPALLDEIQGLYDSSPSRWQFFLTGSSARQLRARSANLLPGRSHSYRLYPVCAWESEPGIAACELRPPGWKGGARAVASPAGHRAFPAQGLSRTLLQGCLPGIRTERPAAGAATLESYVENYLEEEIRREALVREMGPFSLFLRLAASESGNQLNLAKLSQDSGVPASTLKNFFQVLVDTFVGYWIPVYRGKSRKRLLISPRFLFFDLGVRNAAVDFPLAGKVPEALGGTLLENWVGQELLARAGYSGRGYRVSFWRTTHGVEVDYIWETPREDVPIEVTWTARPRPVDARHLETFLDEYAGRARRGLLVCRCDRPEQLTKRVRAIPWQSL